VKREEKLTDQATNVDVRDPTWDRLYTVGGAAGLIVAALLVQEFVIFIIWPQPRGRILVLQALVDHNLQRCEAGAAA
jgi:hypothetical protein